MSDGKTHDKIGFIVGITLTAIGVAWFSWQHCVIFFSGWMLALFIFSPDSDLMPKKRTGLLAIFLYPYALIFKHRGSSHSLLFGTLGRVIYLSVTFLFILWIISKMGYVRVDWYNLQGGIFTFFKNYSLKKIEYQYVTAFYLGMVGADTIHICLDILSSGWKKAKKELF